MKLEISKIGSKKINLIFKIVSSEFGTLDQRISCSSGEINCNVSLFSYEDKIRFHGEYKANLQSYCNLCLEEIDLKTSGNFELILADERSESFSENKEIQIQAIELDFYKGHSLDVSKYFIDQVNLDIPLQVVCKVSCKGICSQCGINLHEIKCECESLSLNNPFADLKNYN